MLALAFWSVVSALGLSRRERVSMNRHNSLSQSQRTAISLVFAFCLPMLASAVAGVARPQLSAAHRHQILSLASNLMSTNPSLAAVRFAGPSLRKIPLCHITPLLHLLPSLSFCLHSTCVHQTWPSPGCLKTDASLLLILPARRTLRRGGTPRPSRGSRRSTSCTRQSPPRPRP